MKSRTKLALLILMTCLSAAAVKPGEAVQLSCSSGVQHCTTASDCASFCRRLTGSSAAACQSGCCICLG
jgi:hypothetical protein